MNKSRSKKTNKRKHPDSVEGIKKFYEKKAVQWFLRQFMTVRILVIVTILLVLFIAARIELLGRKPYESFCRILPIHIPVIDPVIRVIPLSLSYEIEDALGNRRTGKIGDQCCSGDKISISFKAGSDCNALIIGVDSKNIYSIFGEQFKAQGIMENEAYTTNTFMLDTTIGVEAYYLIVSTENLDFKRDIEPEIKRIRSLGGKGALFSDFELKLRSGMYYKYVKFRHENCISR
ncbi:MAG: hypothetical protein JXK07_00970 [Spirochaetes bacterium]|nr:hypothetical protein [Spirochaetota bacterium]